jgi:general secretion pathway protein K
MSGEQARGDGERGIALLLVVWLLALLAIISVAITADARTSVRIARNLVDGAQVQSLADGGIWWAVARIADPDRAAHLRPDGTPYQIVLDGHDLDITVQDERGKLDINAAPIEALAKLLGNIGVDGDVANGLAQAVGRYRERQKALRSTATASTRTPVPTGPQTNEPPFRTVEDLRLIEGLTPEVYQRILAFVTVYSTEPRVNPMTAPREVLLSLPGIDTGAVEELLRRRAAAASETAPSDTLAALPAAGRSLTWADASIVTVRSTARLKNGTAFVREAVVELGGERPFKVLAWRHGLE